MSKFGTSTVTMTTNCCVGRCEMIIVTGAAGFIGANHVSALNVRGERDIIAVDNLTAGDKFRNLVDCDIADYIDKNHFFDLVRKRALPSPDVVFHQGACSDTMETDGRYMMENNFRYSVELLKWCQALKIPLIYASSGSVYGLGPGSPSSATTRSRSTSTATRNFSLIRSFEARLNSLSAPVIGLRYFNVYGPRESHKGRMASVAYHHYNQFLSDGRVKLFEGSHGYANGEQRRDFVYVDDVVQRQSSLRRIRQCPASITSAPAAHRASTTWRSRL